MRVANEPADPGAWLVPCAIILALVALAARPVGPLGFSVTVLAGVVGLVAAAPATSLARPGSRTWCSVVALGAGAFFLARLSLPPPVPFGPLFLAASLAAAVAEEALFRRVMFGRLLRWGAVAAIGGSALAFAAVHVPAYGVAAFAVDLGAGLVFGWQRWATGGWSAPAVTHATANLLQML